MAKGLSLHIGLNRFDKAHYGSDGALKGCENDAIDMQAIADSQGFVSTMLLTAAATRSAVTKIIREAAFELEAGDIFFLSYAGHGGRLPDRNNDEADLLDETWCLYDAQLVDDELKLLWVDFKKGVRVLVCSDSCHSGTILKPAALPENEVQGKAARFLPYPQAEQIFRKHRSFYDELQPAHSPVLSTEIRARVRLLSGCQDNQYSYDGKANGAFTAALKRSWNQGDFKGNYAAFHRHILAQMPERQSPNHWCIGAADATFDKQKPFEI